VAVATWQDVAVALGRPTATFTDDQQAQITYWLDGVELLIKSRLGPVADLDQDVLKFVETEAAAEKVRRGAQGGATSITVTADDGSVTRRYEGPQVTDGDITDAWWDLLDPTRGAGGFSTRPGFEPDATPTDLWSEVAP
jgi:hypothetical protein